VLFVFFEIHANKLYLQLNSTRLQRLSEVRCVLNYLTIFSLMVDEWTLTVDRLSFDAYSWQISFGVEGRILVAMVRAWHAQVCLVRQDAHAGSMHQRSQRPGGIDLPDQYTISEESESESASKRERAKYHPDPDLEHRGGDSEEEDFTLSPSKDSFSLSFSSGRAHIQPSHPIHTHTHTQTHWHTDEGSPCDEWLSILQIRDPPTA